MAELTTERSGSSERPTKLARDSEERREGPSARRAAQLWPCGPDGRTPVAAAQHGAPGRSPGPQVHGRDVSFQCASSKIKPKSAINGLCAR